jgi:peptidylprolyl isomerase
MECLDSQKITLETFEAFLKEQLYSQKILAEITADDKIEEYFQLNSPKFDSVDIKHLVVQGKSQANELMAQLEEESGLFDEFVNDYTLDDETKTSNGRISGIRRGYLETDVEAKVFNAKQGDILGPFQLGNEDLFEIILVQSMHPASLDESTKITIGEAIYEDWLAARMEEFAISTD